MIEIVKTEKGDGFVSNLFAAAVEDLNKELNETIESGEYVYIRDILERMGFDEYQIRALIAENGNVRWGPNGMEREKTTVTSEWVKAES